MRQRLASGGKGQEQEWGKEQSQGLLPGLSQAAWEKCEAKKESCVQTARKISNDARQQLGSGRGLGVAFLTKRFKAAPPRRGFSLVQKGAHPSQRVCCMCEVRKGMGYGLKSEGSICHLYNGGSNASLPMWLEDDMNTCMGWCLARGQEGCRVRAKSLCLKDPWGGVGGRGLCWVPRSSHCNGIQV